MCLHAENQANGRQGAKPALSPLFVSADWPIGRGHRLASLVSFFVRHVFDEINALLRKFERLGTYHFKGGSAIAEIALAPFRIV
jgi:hypothetical protein